MRTAAVALALALPLAGILPACGDASTAPAASTTSAAVPPTTTEVPLLPGDRVEVVRWQETGGCMVLGPNCPTWIVYSDGSVEVVRTMTSPATDNSVQATGLVAVPLVAAVVREARATDETTLAAELGPGSCQSCVDGADVVVTIRDGARSTTLDSLEVSFDAGNPLVDALDELMSVVRSVELPIVSTP